MYICHAPPAIRVNDDFCKNSSPPRPPPLLPYVVNIMFNYPPISTHHNGGTTEAHMRSD